jgi:hypothetical protein
MVKFFQLTLFAVLVSMVRSVNSEPAFKTNPKSEFLSEPQPSKAQSTLSAVYFNFDSPSAFARFCD